MAFISQPSNIIPSTLSGTGDGVIDVTDGLQVSWRFSGNAMVAYQITVYQNDAASTQKYTTNKVTLSTPFYPMDNTGEQKVFEATKITASELSTAGIVNGYANGYKLIIRMYYGAGSTDYVEQSSASAFITRAKPTVTIDTIPDPVDERTISITATYSQAQGDTVEWVNWYLVENTDMTNYLVDTGKIETEVLQLDYDGLLSGSSYSVRLVVQTINGVEADTGWVSFDVEYDVSPSQGIVTACRPYNSPYVQVEWKNETRIDGTASGTVTYDDGKIVIPANVNVIWDNNEGTDILFGKPWTLAWRGKFHGYTSTVQAVVLEGETDNFVVNVTSTGINVTLGSTTIFTKTMTMLPADEFVLVLTPSKYYIKQVTREGGLFPATDLYPSTTLYPEPISRKIYTYNGDITYTQQRIESLKLNGEQDCEYLWLESGELDSVTIGNLIGTEWYEPIYDASTYFIATFKDENIEASITAGNGDTINGSSIYRKEEGETYMKHLVDIEESYVLFRDYGAKAKKNYIYYVFQRGGTTYASAPYVSAVVTPNFGTYALIECEETADNEFHVINCYMVSGNLDSGSLSNNNAPNIQNNFTAYPSVQHSSQNYKSGTLTSLIGTFDLTNNSYSDSWELADDIMALSTRRTAKFLRDTKGALWRIEISGAVTMEVDDESAVLPIQMKLPWVEVADTSLSSIVLTPSDALWERDDIIYTTVYVDLTTGQLVWTVPDEYNGSELVLSNNGELVEKGTGYIEPATMSIDADANLIAQV